MTLTTLSPSLKAQTDTLSVEQSIHQFMKATADNDVHSMHYLLHEKFQGVTSTDRDEMVSKSDYMRMLWGGKFTREEKAIEIRYLDLGLDTASAKLKISSKKETFEADYHFVKGSNGFWQILHIIPYCLEKV